MTQEPISRQQAKQRGFSPLTIAFKPAEQDALDAVMADLDRGDIGHTLVAVRGGVEIWRSSGGMLGTRPGAGSKTL